jgi:hypothetical protein
MSEPSVDDLTKRLFVCCGYVTLESGKPGIAIAEVMAELVQPMRSWRVPSECSWRIVWALIGPCCM